MSQQTFKQRIETELNRIQDEQGVKVLYACESGSRAWGFASPDSDYDVRFIYARPRDWYLSIDIEARRDVIERPLLDELDINGWDVRKALQLLRKSNAPLMEWLQSPIIYRDVDGFGAAMRAQMSHCFSPVATAYHYAQMAKRNFDDSLGGQTVRFKKYFYVLRPLLAVHWIEAGRGLVPTEFAPLLETEILDAPLRAVIEDLRQRKSQSDEAQGGPPIPILHPWLAAQLEQLRGRDLLLPASHPNTELLNTLFQSTLRASWSQS